MTVELLLRALANAMRCVRAEASSPQALHAARSKAWVECLSDEFRSMYPEPDVRVFCKWDGRNRDEFGLNELLYDVCVVRTETCRSAKGVRELRFVTRSLWQVESEFARDSFQAVKDFNKLVIGSAENKLFIGPLLADREQTQYLDTCRNVARCCTGRVLFAAVPHPDAWDGGRAEIRLWELLNDQWQPA